MLAGRLLSSRDDCNCALLARASAPRVQLEPGAEEIALFQGKRACCPEGKDGQILQCFISLLLNEMSLSLFTAIC